MTDLPLPSSLTHANERASWHVVGSFAAALFLSAFLMFLIEPLIARLVLPIFGGAPAVWNSCVLFFQVALLAGYSYAERFLRWADRRSRAALHLALVAAPLAVLPIHLPNGWTPALDANPVLAIVRLLIGAIGLPFFILSTTASTLQYWFARTHHQSARDPYFLYTASNVGSLVGLLAYPVVIEPHLRLRQQAELWTWGYVCFAMLVFVCFNIAWRGAGPRQPRVAARPLPPANTPPITTIRVLRWLALSFVPASLMLGVTTFLSTDVASVPLLWILPLATYLLTFVVAFSRLGAGLTLIANDALPLLAIPVTLFLVTHATTALGFIIPLHLMTFAAAALVCHGALAADRPDIEQLPAFYFWIAVGGAFAGLFNALVAPLVFRSVLEYPIALVGACLLLPPARGLRTNLAPARRRLDQVVPIGVGALAAILLAAVPRVTTQPSLFLAALGLPALISFSQVRRPIRFGSSIGAMLLAGEIAGYGYGHVEYATRTFFGVYHVSTDSDESYRVLYHGTTIHGVQAVDPTRQREPLSYYHRTGPFGQAFAALPIARRTSDVGVIGLGVGSLASYAQPGQRWTFYEIDPEVERIARNPAYFTYLRDCGNACRVIVGDGRLSLAGAAAGPYGLLILDAFSSDAIPMHLLTSEALDLYMSHLTQGGALAFHISNRHLALGPILGRLAEAHGVAIIEQQQDVTVEEGRAGKRASDWVIIAATQSDLGALADDPRWRMPSAPATTPVWTDDFSNILSALRVP